MKEKIQEQWREFSASSLAVNNRKTIYLLILVLLTGGVGSYFDMPRESFPEVQLPEIFVSIPYPGNSPEIIEDKIIKPFEKELNTIKGVEKIKSTAIQDFAVLEIEFDFEISPKEGKRLVEDALSDARTDKAFAQDLPVEPTIQEMDVNEFPIININLSGNYPVEFLKKKGDLLKNSIEGLAEINTVDIRGVQEKKLKIEIRKFDAEAKQISFSDIESAVQSENITTGAGNIKIDGIDHFVIIEGKYNNYNDLRNLVVKHEDNKNIYLWEVADVSFGDSDTSSYARQNGSPVVMLDVKKRAGANIINAIDKIKQLVNTAQLNQLPNDIVVTYTNDQSNKIRSQISNLENSIISGVLLVVGVLLFFLGFRNALFVGVAIPLSMFISFLLLNLAGVSLNIMVLFSLVLALGMLVDNGIVVVENVYRLMADGMNSFDATKKGVGEIAWPIIASTATTLAAFIPLALWPGIMGEFMQYLPITLMIVLGSSLFVALVINPVLIAVLMKVEPSILSKNKLWTYCVVLLLFSGVSFLFIEIWLGNLLAVSSILLLLFNYVLNPLTALFQEKTLPWLELKYQKLLHFAMEGKRPVKVLFCTFGILILSFVLVGLFPPKVLFFPDNQPNYLNIFVELPVGTNIKETNKKTALIKAAIDKVLNTPKASLDNNSYNSIFDSFKAINEQGVEYVDTVYFIESVIEQVGKGTSDPMEGPSFGETPNKARITVSFCEFSHRKGLNTSEVKQEIELALTNKFTADVKIIVDKEKNGPPQDPAVNIEITGSDDYGDLILAATKVKHYLDTSGVEGMQKLKLNVELNKAEIKIKLDREYAKRSGLSTGQISSTIRTALFGKDVSTYAEGEDNYDINIRFNRTSRETLESLLDQSVMFMNNRGEKLKIPISSVIKEIDVVHKNDAIKRLNLTNMVTVFSGVKEGYNENEIVTLLQQKMETYQITPNGKDFITNGLKYDFTGKIKEQEKELAFLSSALLIAVFLILLILVTQFNSFSIPFIILFSVVLSLSGVFLGIVIARNDFVIIMTMIGIISLAGIVVNNAIVLVDYTNLLRKRKRKELKLVETDQLSTEHVKNAIILGGKRRLRPVLLTAITTILGLLPLATGLNINFITLFTRFDAQLFFGGDNVIFFGPMSLAIIYGLTFATFLTLVVVPVMYFLIYKFKLWFYKFFNLTLRSNI
jgi:multidrug efflux pump subunit AcrB